MPFKPMGTRVLIDPLPIESVSKLVMLPNEANDRPQYGVVIALGEKRTDPYDLVQVGTKVLFAKFSGTPIELEGKNYLILNDDAISGIVQE